jgi:hypothetical protein
MLYLNGMKKPKIQLPPAPRLPFSTRSTQVHKDANDYNRTESLREIMKELEEAEDFLRL